MDFLEDLLLTIFYWAAILGSSDFAIFGDVVALFWMDLYFFETLSLKNHLSARRPLMCKGMLSHEKLFSTVCSRLQVGTCFVATSTYEPFKHYMVQGKWIDSLWSSHKLAHEQYLEYAYLGWRHRRSLPSCHPAILPCCHPAILPSCHPAILPCLLFFHRRWRVPPGTTAKPCSLVKH